MLCPNRLSPYNLDICFIFAEGIIEKGEVFSKAVQNVGNTGKKLLSFGWLAVHKRTKKIKAFQTNTKIWDLKNKHLQSGAKSCFIRATSPASVTPLLNMGLVRRGWLVFPLSQ